MHVTSRAVWHLTIRKLSPSQDSYFGHMVNNVDVNLGARLISDAGEGVSNSLSHTPPSPSFYYLLG